MPPSAAFRTRTVLRIILAVIAISVIAAACSSSGDSADLVSGAIENEPIASGAIENQPIVSDGTDSEPVVSGETDSGSIVPGDGVLDCLDGQVVRSADIDTSGDTEPAAVAAALEQWTDQGGSLVELPLDESWSAVLDGRDVAIAYPELDGTGTWVVHDVQTCGEPETGPAAVDGELDCVNEIGWSIQGSLLPTSQGLPSAEEAIRSALDPYAERHGGEIVLVQDRIGSLVVQEREQVIARASEAPAGGWVVTTIAGCGGFE